MPFDRRQHDDEPQLFWKRVDRAPELLSALSGRDRLVCQSAACGLTRTDSRAALRRSARRRLIASRQVIRTSHARNRSRSRNWRKCLCARANASCAMSSASWRCRRTPNATRKRQRGRFDETHLELACEVVFHAQQRARQRPASSCIHASRSMKQDTAGGGQVQCHLKSPTAGTQAVGWESHLRDTAAPCPATRNCVGRSIAHPTTRPGRDDSRG